MIGLDKRNWFVFNICRVVWLTHVHERAGVHGRV